MQSVKRTVGADVPLGVSRGHVEKWATANGWHYYHQPVNEPGDLYPPPETKGVMINGIIRVTFDPAMIGFFSRGWITVTFLFDRDEKLIEVQYSSKIEGL